jgi:Uma2 family endonuclease
VKIYAAAGIPEYWVVDLKDKSLIVFREPVGETYQQMNRLTEGEIAPLAFPDVRISVRRLMS